MTASALVFIGCAGGTFTLQSQLAATPALSVKGDQVSTGACAEGNTKTSLELLHSGLYELGDLKLLVAEPKTETRGEVLQIEVIRSVRTLLERSESLLNLSQGSLKLDVQALVDLENEKLGSLRVAGGASITAKATPEVKQGAAQILPLFSGAFGLIQSRRS